MLEFIVNKIYPLVVRESAPKTTPPSYSIAIIVVYKRKSVFSKSTYFISSNLFSQQEQFFLLAYHI